MTLHIFNPEHDIALASGLDNFTAPHAGRQLRHDLGWLPAFWAEEGDGILVDDADYAQKKLHRRKRILPNSNVQLQTWAQTSFHQQTQKIDVWGWDADVRARLRRIGISEDLLPSDSELESIRQLSHRRTSATLLTQLTSGMLPTPLLIGEAIECTSMEELLAGINKWGHVVLKAPWSSSGRGIRFINGGMSVSEQGWAKNILRHQGSVMLEPYYNKVKDFGMEFYSDGKGRIEYLGLSLFHTANGAYTGNLLATENRKRKEMQRYLPIALLDEVQQAICNQLVSTIGTHYEGPFGIDMMIVSGVEPTRQFLLHPCVEINLRRTMGHVALALTRHVNTDNDDDLIRVMRIDYADHQYKLKIVRV